MNRKYAAQACRREAETCIKYIDRAKAADRYTSARNNAFEMAKCACACAMQAHEELWALTGGNMTDDEFTAFEAAEIAENKLRFCVRGLYGG